MTSQRYENLAGAVADVLARAESASAETVEQVSAEYMMVGEELNERLRKTSSLLRRGLRDDALQECQREPNLLDAVQLLDIHDVDAWQAAHRRHQMATPPALLIEQAAELNRAYAEHAPLQDLLKKHRLLALGLAPLKQRLRMLRLLAERDASSEMWDADVAVFERARLAEVRGELAVARRSQDLPAVAELEQELASPGWRTIVPPELRGEVRDCRVGLEREAARAQLRVAAVEVAAAHAEFDVDRARQARDLWELHLPAAVLPDDDALLDNARPAFEWLREQEDQRDRQFAFESALGELTAALDDPAATRDELEPPFHQIARLEYNLPAVTQQRYRNRLAEFNVRENRRHTLKLVAIAGSLLLIAGLIVAGVRSRQFHSEIDGAVARLRDHQQNRQWDQGEAFADSLQANRPAVFADADFQTALTELVEAGAIDRQRAKSFQELVQQIQAEGLGADDRGALQAAQQLAATPTEKERLAELEAGIDAAQQQLAVRQNAELAERTQTLSRRLETLQQNAIPQHAELPQLRDALQSLRQEYPLAIHSVTDALLARVNTIEDDWQHNREIDAVRQRVTEAVGDPQRFFAALGELRERFPDEPTARQIQRVLDDADAHASLAAWQDVGRKYLSGRIGKLRPEAARQATTEIATLRTRSEVPLPAWQEALPVIDAVAARIDASGEPIQRALAATYESWLLRDLFCVEAAGAADDRQTSRLYFLTDPSPLRPDPTGRVTLKCVADASDKFVTRDCRVPGDAQVRPAPQTELSADVRRSLQELDGQLLGDGDAWAWEKAFVAIIRRIAASPGNGPAADPILRLNLLRDAVRTAVAGSRPLKHGFRSWLTAFERNAEKVDQICQANWLLAPGILRVRELDGQVDVASPAAIENSERMRVEAARFCDSLPDLDDCVRQVGAELQADSRPLPQLQWIGWVSHDRSGRARILTRAKTKEDGKLFVAPRVREAGALHAVGRLAANGIQITESDSQLLLEGSPVYLVSGQ